ncbi:MAG: D-3-phosphoglycerate dehydrogenase (EC [uncultured Sulfurovum sp.]|uniref:D-3-phosphoglycerate dehydrogenase (EC) n=1 Tax=uncultured Sulfurovum sp. TaxID=269237 RepID=A0A6S6UD28_9BACT|nr:MAG: D-3-phosphoglycerate dehydrogenase (EC [uncultured Sulfurovum sp.]
MNIVLLDKKTLGDDLDLSALATLGKLTSYETTTKEETLERIQNAEVIITNKVLISKEIMAQASNLKLICIAATGMNNVDLEAAKECSILVKNVSGYSTSSVVQHTFSMMFYLLEKLEHYNKQVKSKAWTQSGLFTDISQPFSELSGKTWGIIGLGTIGKEVAKVAEAFGVRVCYHSTSGKNLINDYHHYPLNELLAKSDIISIHCPLNEQTLNLINQSNLVYVKDKAILLNLGRGGIINEQDLAKELNKRELYAGLDVLSSEPIEEDNPLLSIKNEQKLIITPHLAWASFESRQRLLEGVMDNIKNHVKEKKL